MRAKEVVEFFGGQTATAWALNIKQPAVDIKRPGCRRLPSEKLNYFYCSHDLLLSDADTIAAAEFLRNTISYKK